MAVGVPVVSSNTGGIPEVNIHGVSGFLSNVGDVDDMAKNSLDILKPENLNNFKLNARKQSSAFSLDIILPMYEEIYLNLVKVSNK
jgi:glycosyltransferase involved in cell wall biosynthesis